MEKQTKKRYYRVGEKVWVHSRKSEAEVVVLDIPNKNVVVNLDGKEEQFKLWEIDKLKYKAKDKFFKENPDKKKSKKKGAIITKGELSLETNPKVQLMMPLITGSTTHLDPIPSFRFAEEKEMAVHDFKNLVSLGDALANLKRYYDSIMYPDVYFAKVHPNAVVPTKRDEDAGYDLYACVEKGNFHSFDSSYEGQKEGYLIHCPANKTTLVPTGLAFALPKTHYLNAKHERGSTGKISLSVLAGVVDSGYRGEVFIAITPLNKDVIITSQVTETLETEDRIYYPYSKAIAQATVDLVPKTKLTELSFDELKKIESERGDTKLGQSGK